jgi:hypothetical protein
VTDRAPALIGHLCLTPDVGRTSVAGNPERGVGAERKRKGGGDSSRKCKMKLMFERTYAHFGSIETSVNEILRLWRDCWPKHLARRNLLMFRIPGSRRYGDLSYCNLQQRVPNELRRIGRRGLVSARARASHRSAHTPKQSRGDDAKPSGVQSAPHFSHSEMVRTYSLACGARCHNPNMKWEGGRFGQFIEDKRVESYSLIPGASTPKPSRERECGRPPQIGDGKRLGSYSLTRLASAPNPPPSNKRMEPTP